MKCFSCFLISPWRSLALSVYLINNIQTLSPGPKNTSLVVVIINNLLGNSLLLLNCCSAVNQINRRQFFRPSCKFHAAPRQRREKSAFTHSWQKCRRRTCRKTSNSQFWNNYVEIVWKNWCPHHIFIVSAQLSALGAHVCTLKDMQEVPSRERPTFPFPFNREKLKKKQ